MTASITDYVIYKKKTLNELGMDGEEESSSYSKFTKVKCQVVHTYVMKVCRGSGGKPPDVNFGNRYSSVSITFRPLYQHERTPVPLEQEADWAP